MRNGSGDSYNDGEAIVCNTDKTLYAQWSKGMGTCKVTYNSNWSDATTQPETKTQTVPINKATPLSANGFKRDGWIFSHWNTMSDAKGKSYSDQEVVSLTQDLTLYAKWEPTVTFNANGGAGAMERQQVSGNTPLIPNSFTKRYYDFAYWSLVPDGTGTKFDNQALVSFNEPVTLYAQWTPSQNTRFVTFDRNGTDGITGNMEQQAFAIGEKIRLNQCQYSRAGYRFLGWHTTPNQSTGGTAYTDRAEAQFAGNTTLYAQWAQISNTFLVTFHQNGGTGTMLQQSATSGTTIKLRKNEYKRDGYVFDAWYTNSDGTGTRYEDEAEITPTTDVNLYAKWKEGITDYTLTYDGNGATSGSMSAETYATGATAMVRDCAFKRDGYAFDSWKGSDGKTYNFNDEIVMTSDLTLTAQWTEDKSHTITYIGNGGTGYMEPDSGATGTKIKVKKCGFVYEHHTFDYWKGSDGKSYDAGEEITIGNTNISLTAQWKEGEPPEICTISFDGNGGKGEMTDQEVVKGVPTRLKNNNYTREGHALKEWNTQPNGLGDSYEPRASVTTDVDMKLYAIWEVVPNKYTVTFDANGGAGTMPTQTVTEYEYCTLNDNTFTRDGYTFTGWNTEPEGTGAVFADAESVVISENLTLYAQWKLGVPSSKHSITFDSNGATENPMSSQTVEDGVPTHLKSNTITRDGFTFAGWNTESDGQGQSYDNEQIVTLTKDLVLYAQWTAGTTPTDITVKFHSNTGVGSMSVQEINDGDKSTLNANTFMKDGYKFAGWNTAPNGRGQKFDDGADLKEFGINNDLSLYAQWESILRTIYFDNNEGSGEMPPQTGNNGETVELNENVFTKDGYDFTGWNTAADGSGTPHSDRERVKLTSDLRLYAQWRKKGTSSSIYVTFYPNGGTGTMPEQEMTANTSTKLDANTFRRSGYSFAGWNTLADGSGTSYGNQQTVSFGSSQTLYAQWDVKSSPDSQTVTFHSNGGTGTMTAQLVPTNTSTKLKPNTFTKSGYSFTGWNTLADGTGTSYGDQQSVKLNSGLDLYAQWTKGSSSTTYTVRYSSGGGTGSMESQSGSSGSSITVKSNSFTRSGYTFDYWKGSDGKTYKSGDKITLTQNLTLTAQWKQNSSTTTRTTTTTTTTTNNNNNNNTRYTVTFYPNGGTGTMSSQSVTANTSTNLKSNTFSRTGYTFRNWNTRSDGTGTTYTNGQSVRLNSDLTLYAQWIEGSNSSDRDSTSSTSRPTGLSSSSSPSSPTPGGSSTTPTNPTQNPSSRTATGPTNATGAANETQRGNLASTGDPTSYLPIIIAAVAGIVLVGVAIFFRRKNR